MLCLRVGSMTQSTFMIYFNNFSRSGIYNNNNKIMSQLLDQVTNLEYIVKKQQMTGHISVMKTLPWCELDLELDLDYIAFLNF